MALTERTALDRVGPYVERLRARLSPACDPGEVRASLAAVVTGCDVAPRTRDGRRTSVLTPSGWPLEVSVSTASATASQGSEGGLRFVGEPGARLPFFGPRLAAQRRAIDALADGSLDDLRALPDVLFPEPAAVPARTRFATFVGVAHGASTAVKVYGNVRAHDPAATAARLTRRWPAFGALFDLVADLPGLVPTFVALQSADRRLTHKLYVRAQPDLDGDLGRLARRLGADTSPLAATLAGERVDLGASVRPVVVAVSDRPPQGADVVVHLPARALGAGPDRMAVLAERAAQTLGCRPAPLAALTAAMQASGEHDPWEPTVLGIGLAAGSSPSKVNLYAAPSESSRPYSNSG